jgi:hypothetical protein
LKKAYLYFWDGFRFGPRIQTDWVDLKSRIVRALRGDELLPGHVAARFVAFDIAEEHRTSVWNSPPARTTGQYVAAAESEGQWPYETFDTSMADFPQAGVFIVNTVDGTCRITGGVGFSDEDCNPRMLREVQLLEEDDDEASSDRAAP